MTDVRPAVAPPPAWSVAFADPAPTIVIATYGAQSRDEATLEPFVRWFDGVKAAASGPLVSERARFVDAAGYCNDVYLAYWKSPDAFARWASSDAVAAWWDHADRTENEIGVWREVVTIPSERYETILSAPTVRIGPGRMADSIEGPIDAHGYWGSMRERLPIAAVDPLLSSHGEALTARHANEREQRRIFVKAPENLALIRSGQDAARCDDDEFREYEKAIRPVLKKGMDFLRNNPQETGCCSCRFMEEVEDDGISSPRSFGFAWFLTLGHLERWAKSHPTHLAIFNRFAAFAQKRGPSLQLDLWHEVSVIPEHGSIFEYVNCHNQTGLLGFFGQSESVAHAGAAR